LFGFEDTNELVLVTETEKYKYLGSKSDPEFPNVKSVKDWI